MSGIKCSHKSEEAHRQLHLNVHIAERVTMMNIIMVMGVVKE
jgi:hypothetical protein